MSAGTPDGHSKSDGVTRDSSSFRFITCTDDSFQQILGRYETYRSDELGASGLEIFLLLKDQWGAVGGGRRGGAEERGGFVVVEGVQGAAGGRRRNSERAQTGHALAGRTLGRRPGALGGCHDMESKVNANHRVAMNN